jgi:uncharacterized protein YbbC (DUF1343 family)
VAMIPAPMHYGMTPGETAGWLNAALGIGADLHVARMSGYHRQPGRDAAWPPWIPPSPGIESWHSGQCYTATVFTEAFAALDRGRGTGLAFQVIGAPWLKAAALCEMLEAAGLPGVRFHLHTYTAQAGDLKGVLVPGIRLAVTDPGGFRPVQASIHIMHALQRLHGKRRLWGDRGARPEWIDRLYATAAVRAQLLDGAPPGEIVASWQPGLRAFRLRREAALLYQPA